MCAGEGRRGRRKSMWKQGTMRRHLPIVLASAALLAGAATGVAQAAPGAKGAQGRRRQGPARLREEVGGREAGSRRSWTPDFSVQHYKDMLFTPGGGSYGNPSLTDFYQELSSGRFAWDGQVSNWTPINGTKADFGANSEAAGDGGDDANGPVSRVVKATLDGLVASGNYGGIDIAKVDKTDRYDCDHDGNFN